MTFDHFKFDNEGELVNKEELAKIVIEEFAMTPLTTEQVFDVLLLASQIVRQVSEELAQ